MKLEALARAFLALAIPFWITFALVGIWGPGHMAIWFPEWWALWADECANTYFLVFVVGALPTIMAFPASFGLAS